MSNMPQSKRPLKVFLCHASQDKPKVRELYRTLRRRGMQPWLDAEDLIPGQNWEVEIPKALYSSDAIIICLSPNSVDKEGYVQKEVKFALDKALEMPEGRIFLIPAKLEECDLPYKLRQYQAVNLFEKDGYTKLMKALKLRASELKLAAVELPGAGEITSEIEKIVEEKKEKEEQRSSSENRILEAAVEKQVSVGVPTSLFVWIKRPESKSLISVVSSIDEDVVLDKDNVKSKGLEIEFPVENGRVLPARISLRLFAHEFTPSIQQKQIFVPPEGDSEVCTFIITPNRAGKLLLNLEVIKDQVSIATKSIRTTAIEAENKERGSMAIVSIPIIVFVHGKSKVKKSPSESTSVNIKGNVQGNIFIGDHNQVAFKYEDADEKARKETEEKARLEAEEHLRQDRLELEAAEKAVREKVKRDSAEKTRRERAERRAAQIATLREIFSKSFNSLKIAHTNAKPLLRFGCILGIIFALVWAGSWTISKFFHWPVKTDSKGISMVFVSAGEFMMGDDESFSNERPAHKVYLDAFYVDRYEVTNAHYRECVVANKCEMPFQPLPNETSMYDAYPVVNVDWNMAEKYCEWRGARLPTEAEWEKAARGVDGFTYPWGEDMKVEYVNYNNVGTKPVRSYPNNKSPYGVYDMAGNVAEWVFDWYSLEYYRFVLDNGVLNPKGPQVSPFNSSHNYYGRVLRGGSWRSNSLQLTTTYRSRLDPAAYADDLGFRCVVSANP